MITKVETYQNEAGATIFAHTPVDVNGPTVFKSTFTFVLETPLGQMQVSIPKEFEASSMVEAFAKFPDVLQAARTQAIESVAEKVAAANKPTIVRAGAVPELNGHHRGPRLAT